MCLSHCSFYSVPAHAPTRLFSKVLELYGSMYVYFNYDIYLCVYALGDHNQLYNSRVCKDYVKINGESFCGNSKPARYILYGKDLLQI